MSRGFTLIEVLVAFTIMAVAMGAAFATIGSGLTQERRASETVQRVLAARSILDGLGIEAPLQDGEVDGVLETGETWRAEVREVALDEGGDGTGNTDGMRLYQVDLTIQAGGRPVMSFAVLKRELTR